MSTRSLLIELATEVLNMQDEIEYLRRENSRLKEVEKEHHDFLDETLNHHKQMSANILEAALDPNSILSRGLKAVKD